MNRQDSIHAGKKLRKKGREEEEEEEEEKGRTGAGGGRERKSNTSKVEGDCGRSEERAKLAEL